MKLYIVVWEIDIEAESPEEAARMALEVQRNPDSIATVFEVYESGTGDPPEVIDPLEIRL